ncbi:Beta-N-acetylhexosaminidase [Hexamita inflata]|uniref:beta-N-acetylhexosaminidase n=1 Tax=Hexamita inflata TaxID=28002 RepID=A0AA86QBB9_9EUKA|nr:Beta-N-acetylhexosaminidase [Hexamita inflata]
MIVISVFATIAPIPVNYTSTESRFRVGDLNFTCILPNGSSCLETIAETIIFYKPLIYPAGAPIEEKKAITQFKLLLTTTNLPMDFRQMNETYSITVNNSVIVAEAHDPFGAARVFATLCQMVEPDFQAGIYFIQESKVWDKPAFPYRAVQVDSSRHFLPISTLKRQVAALSIAKMSVLHLHESDSQSFPMKTDTAPGSNFYKGSWKTGGELYYHTLKDMKELATYAKNLGVYLMLEFDMPGHADSWRRSGDNINCACGDVINPTLELTYDYIKSYMQDIFNTIYKPFGFTPLIHLGGDEVNHWCFKDDPKVKGYMEQNNLDERGIQQMLHNRVIKIIDNLTNEMYPERNNTQFRFYWQEAFSNGNNMENGGVVHSWMHSYVIKEAANKNYFSIRSQGWYLDVNQPGGNQEIFVDSWKDFYKVNPAEGLDEKQRLLCLGGGGCQWGEKVHDGNIDEQIWPRSLAISEVLWSNPKDTTITQKLKVRLNNLTCKLRSAGTSSGALIPSAPCPGVDSIPNKKRLDNWRQQDAFEQSDEKEGWGNR